MSFLATGHRVLDWTGRLRHLAGWVRDRPDHRDQLYRNDALAPNPARADNTQWIGRVDDQLDIGSCTANATAGAMEMLYRKEGLADPFFSRLFIYYASRVLVEGVNPSDDSGAMIRDVMKAVASYGACFESVWPYDPFQFAVRPSTAAFAAAKAHTLIRYNTCPTLDNVKTMVALGYPVVFGFSVPESFMSAATAKTGMALYPLANESFVGGHAVLAVGYDDQMVMPGETAPGSIRVLNSWGPGWGLNGQFNLPYRYFLTGLADDAWAIRKEGMQ